MTLSKAKRRAYELRQKDTGWGRVIAHFIPYYGLYYAISRRTITPLFYAFGIILIAFGIFGISLIIIESLNLLSLEPTTEWAEGVAGLMVLAANTAQTIGVKLGINKARKYARIILETEGWNQRTTLTSYS